MANAVEPVESARFTDDRWGHLAVWVRRGAMALLAAVVIAALSNLFGQRATTAHATSLQAQLDVRSPSTVRPGLLFQTKITITAKVLLPDSQLVLGAGYIDGLTLNTLEPSPKAEHSGVDGSLIFDLGTLRPGVAWVQYLDFQV